jgi:hypothetical protein
MLTDTVLQLVSSHLHQEYTPLLRYNSISVLSSLINGRRRSNNVDNHASFNFSQTYLRNIGFPITRFSSIDENNCKQFVFLTAASDDHFNECLDAIALVQRYFPQHKLVFYDLSIRISSSRFVKVYRVCFRRFWKLVIIKVDN